MTEKCQGEETWKPTQEQIDEIILPGMQDIAQKCAGYLNELQCPSQFIGVMLRDIAEAFEAEGEEGDSN